MSDDDSSRSYALRRKIGRAMFVVAGALIVIALIAAGARYCEKRDPGDPIINIQIG